MEGGRGERKRGEREKEREHVGQSTGQSVQKTGNT